jgi:membrane-associated phospholipid phosphatase
LTFSVATAAATIATIRDRPYAPWMWVAGVTLATGVAYLRVAGDAHWFSDVAVGAAVGSAVGFAVPWFFHRVRTTHPGLDVRPAPGGLALVF